LACSGFISRDKGSVFNFGNYPILAIPAISLCGSLPASLSHDPTPRRAFVENKSQTPIRPSGDRAVEAAFLRFSALEPPSISALFSRFNCPVGRGSQKCLMFGWIADY
jgi:hypothetical protein